MNGKGLVMERMASPLQHHIFKFYKSVNTALIFVDLTFDLIDHMIIKMSLHIVRILAHKLNSSHCAYTLSSL